MQVTGLDGKQYKWNLSLYLKKRQNCSAPHKRARELLATLFPFQTICEEVPLHGSRLFGDFYLPMEKLMIEVQGEQHTTHIPHFHPTKLDYFHATANDRKKIEWCRINDIRLVQLPSSENDDEWRSRINN